MRLTQTHVAFWRERKGTPGWAHLARTKVAPRGTSVDDVINEHAGINWRPTMAASNLMYLLRLVLRNGIEPTLRGYLLRIACDRATHPQRRVLARRWARRIKP